MTIQTSVPDYRAAREAMVDSQLRPQGVNNAAVVDAMASVPREQFVAEGSRPLAYSDRSVPVGGGRSMSSPTVLGLLLTELAPVAGERALVVGCGTGYSAALLKAIGVEVIGLEQDEALAAEARGHGVEVVQGPLAEGWKKGAPYDLILIDGAIEHIPDAIVAQLSRRAGSAPRSSTAASPGSWSGAGRARASAFTRSADAGAASLPGFDKPRGFAF